MATWQIDQPQKLTFDQVRRVRVQTARGGVSVVGSDDRPTLEVSELEGPPLEVHHDGDQLTVGYERPSWPSALGWLLRRPRRYLAVLSLAVPRDCEVDVEVVAGSVMVSGMRAPVRAKSVSGEVTLAGCAGQVEANTVSGAVQAHGVAGDLWAETVSGDLTLAEGGGTVGAKTISGTVLLDLTSAAVHDVRVTSISGDVTIRLPQASDLQVQLQSTSGQVASAFDELWSAGRPALSTVSGRLGAGTGRLRASTTSGQIALLRREPEAEEPR